LRMVNLSTGSDISLDKGDYDAFAGSISPDGQWVVYTTNKDVVLQLYKITSTGSGKSVMTTFPNGASLARFSPTGTKLVFVSGETSDDIYRMNLDGSGVSILSALAADESDPAFSPDGGKIVYTEDAGTVAAPHRKIMTMNADGTGKRTITSGFDDC